MLGLAIVMDDLAEAWRLLRRESGRVLRTHDLEVKRQRGKGRRLGGERGTCRKNEGGFG